MSAYLIAVVIFILVVMMVGLWIASSLTENL